MTRNLWGADVDALRALARSVEDAARRLDGLRDHVDSLVSTTPWRGGDAEQFQGEWSTTLRGTVHRASSTLSDAATTLRADADAQDEASRASSGTGSPGAATVGAGATTTGPAVLLAAATGPEPSPSPGPPPVPPAEEDDDGVDDGSREDQRQESRRDTGGGEGTADPTYQVPGPAPFPNGLGTPVPGTEVDPPEPPVWNPPDEGSDVDGPSWNTEDASFGDHVKEWTARQAANALSATWPDAARNLHHYLGNSGGTLEQPVDTMLADLPDLASQVAAREAQLGADAVRVAQESGADGPVTMPVNTDWKGYYAGPDQDKNWYYATGGFSYNVSGQVTVYPPDPPGGPWRYEMDTGVNYRDRYNWDGTKSTQIGPLTITDAELQEFHRKGLAQEFTMVGSSSTRHSEGTG